MEYKYTIDKKKLKKISLQFRRVASRLLNTDFDFGVENVNRLLNFIQSTPIIYDFILKNNNEKLDFETINNTRENEERRTFEIPLNKSDEIAFVYQLLLYISENVVHYGVFTYNYGSGNKFQNHTDAFNNVVVKPFINHIIEYLEEIKIDMGMDEKTSVSINVESVTGGQINVNQGGSTLNASYINKNSKREFDELITKINELFESSNISSEQLEDVKELMSVIKEELEKDKPKKSVLKLCKDKVEDISSIAINGGKILSALNKLFNLIQPLNS